MSDEARAQLDVLCGERERLARKLDLEPALLGARGTLEEVVAGPEGVSELLRWQVDVFGESLQKSREALGFGAAE
jgi:hypothetical protein